MYESLGAWRERLQTAMVIGLYRTRAMSGEGCRNMTTRSCTQATRWCRCLYVFVVLTLRLVLIQSAPLRPAVADEPCDGVRQHEVTLKTIQADVVLEGRVERVLGDARRMMVVRVLTVFKGGRRLRRHQAASSINSTRLRVAVDCSSVTGGACTVAQYNDDDASVDVTSVTPATSLARGSRLIVFLRQRHSDSVLVYYVTSGGRRRRRRVDLYQVSATPAAATESARETARKYSRRRNG